MISENILFEPQTAAEILNRAKIFLAPMLPGCTARRYDFPLFEGYYPVQLCFTDHGPILPVVSFGLDRFCAGASADVYYKMMFRDPKDLGVLDIRSLPVFVRLDWGPETIASKVHEAIARVDFANMIADCMIERILVEKQRHKTPWSNFYLGLSAVYLGRYDEARALLKTCLEYLRKDGRGGYGPLPDEAESTLAKVEQDGYALRQELIAITEENWSDLKIVNLKDYKKK